MTATTDIERALAKSERAGLRTALTVRSALVFALILFIAGTQGPLQGWLGVSVFTGFLAIGLVYRWLVIRERDALWMRYAFVALEFGIVAVAAAVAPLSREGEVPQIFVFRVYGIGIFFFLLATSALSLSPRLVLWTGFCAVVALWGAWVAIVLDMERVITWAEIAGQRTAEKYVEIVLDPAHIQLANRFVETLLLAATAAVTAAAVHRARQLLRDQMAAESARSRVAEVFGRYVPPQVAAEISASGGTLRPETRTATVMFVDIEGFTGIAERVAPETLVVILDTFFDTVTDMVQAEQGVVISFIGDAALAAFNAPLANPDHAASACRAARALLDKVDATAFGGQRLAIRIGIATGEVAAATVGGRGRRAYTLYGDTVNLAQRLEVMNKETGTRHLMSGETWEAAGRPDSFQEVGEVQVQGRARPVRVFGPAGAAPAGPERAG